ncbi:MAG: uroporphyrinogen-III synthase, partial [Rhodospirillaceae bacterium]|nr:uroporphyrinogen-III synthase [Rhodospirillaceae bacterium]
GSLARTLATRLQHAPQTAAAQILIAVAENAGGVLQGILSAAGGACIRVDVYRTVPVTAPRAKRTLSALGADKILLASPSAVTGLLNQIELDTAAELFSTGPSTTRAARAAELTVTAEAASPSLEGLLETMR